MTARDLWLRLRALVLRRRVERELHEELDFHLAMQTRRHIAAGLDATEAQRLAHAQFGSTALIEDRVRDARGIYYVETLAQDVRYAIRSFRRAPAFALTVVSTIALGLGLNAAVFTIFNAYVLKPFSVRDPYSLYWHGGRGGRLPDRIVVPGAARRADRPDERAASGLVMRRRRCGLDKRSNS